MAPPPAAHLRPVPLTLLRVGVSTGVRMAPSSSTQYATQVRASLREGAARVAAAGADALLGLLDGGFGQADDLEGDHAAGDVGLDRDLLAVQADHRARE